MTIVKMSRRRDNEPMQFEFDSTMEAFVFYGIAKDTYREDDMVIEMTEEGDE